MFVGQSPLVQFILNFFILYAGPENKIVKARIVYSYYNYLQPLIENCQIELDPNLLHGYFNLEKETPDLFKSWFRSETDDHFDPSIMNLSLYDLAIKIVVSFNLYGLKGQMVFLEAFLDLLLQYGREEAGGLTGFLEWWELSGKDKTISLSEGHNAISIYTIHKSKGLEFHTVFIPFCNWEISPDPRKAGYLWCKPEKPPFNLLDLVLVKYNKGLTQTIFSEAYFKEMLYSYVDNLNLLYVAFTRAINSLFIFCPYSDKKEKTINTVAALMQHLIERPSLLDSIDLKNYISLSEFYNPETKILSFGEQRKVINTDTGKVSGDFEMTQLSLTSSGGRLKLKLHNDNYHNLFESQHSEMISHGNLLHELFENISTVSDVSSAVKRIVSEGKIDTQTGQRYEAIIHDLLRSSPFCDWFNGKWKVLNERDILRGKDGRHRPDRVMVKDNQVIVVDYKTGIKSDHHFTQVMGYLKDFKNMNYNDSKGFIWYLSNNELIEVK